jgi:hydroxyacylglutathione hydrolase
MKLEQIISEGIAANSYFIADGDKAIVVDPRRDIDIYLELAKKHETSIIAIFDTHRNEDFVNGSPELAEILDVPIYHGKALPFKYGTPVKEGDTFKLNSMEIEILETPGHTPESISIVLKEIEKDNKPYLVCTGDALFAGDTGRIDFYRDDKAQKKAAEQIYDSLFNKIFKLGDDVLVLPAHGGGSVCGEGISNRPFTTVGYEKATNPLLQKSKKEFIDKKAKESLPIAPYMEMMEKLNLNGAEILHNLPHPPVISTQQLKKHLTDGTQILDVRDPRAYLAGNIPKSIFIWQEGIPMFAGWFLNYDKPIIIVKESDQNIDAIIRYLIRLGFDNINGVYSSFLHWVTSGEKANQSMIITPEKLNNGIEDDSIVPIDVRSEEKIAKGKITGALELDIHDEEFTKKLKSLPKDKQLCFYCTVGNSSTIATSLAFRVGLTKVGCLLGGSSAWKNAGFKFTKGKE